MAEEIKVPRLSPSIAKTLIEQSPKHAWQEHWLLGGTKSDPTPAMEKGSLMDLLLLSPEEAPGKIVIVLADDWKTKAAKEQREAARWNRLLPVLEKDYIASQETAKALAAQFQALGSVFPNGRNQVKLEWESDGALCKGRLDMLSDSGGHIGELKTTEDANPAAMSKKFINYGYDIQAAAYIEAVEANDPSLAGRARIKFYFCELKPPYAVVVVEPAGSMLELGRQRWARAKQTWAECMKTGIWAAYGKDVHRVEAPAWAMTAEFEQTLMRDIVAEMTPKEAK